MILIYAHTLTPRLQYTCDFIFKEQLGIAYSFTGDGESFKNETGPKINYSTSDIPCRYTIKNVPLLFEENIQPQDVNCVEIEGFKAFYSNGESPLYFDIFAAAFYLLSRYEEYLPQEKDAFGRFDHTNSLAFKENFLHTPLLNKWIDFFADTLEKAYPQLSFERPNFTYLPTYDIDIAWAYRQKGFLRSVGGFLKKPTFLRLQVLLGNSPDPYDCYAFLHKMHTSLNLKPFYFFLVAAKTGQFDKNPSLHSHAFKNLLQQHAALYKVGLHPSWQSFTKPSLIKEEKYHLQQVTGKPITSSRQHYIKFNLPATFQNLISAGITNDYSMGYGTVNGFRASVANSFLWFDLLHNKITNLRLHPFCFMDANSFFEQRLSIAEAENELNYFYNVCKNAKGSMITIFHNNIVGAHKNWRSMYEGFLRTVSERL